jgi:hypothetical protein
MLGEQVSSSWSWRLGNRHQGVLQRATSYPREDPGIKVSKEIARAYVRDLEQHVKDIPMELILSVDEAGSQEQADLKQHEEIIPHQWRDHRVEYTVSLRRKSTSVASEPFRWWERCHSW